MKKTLRNTWPSQLWLWGRCLLLCVLLVVAARHAKAQSTPRSYFRPDAAAQQRASASPLAQQLRQYQTYTLDLAGLRTALAGAGLRQSGQGLTLSLPQPNGSFQRFSVWEAPLLAPALAAQYPGVHTYGGQGIDDPTARLSLTISPTGLLAQMLSERPTGATYLEASSPGDALHYVSYYARDVQPAATGAPGSCGGTVLPIGPPPTPPRSSGTAGNRGALVTTVSLRVFRVVVNTTKEYTNGRNATAVMTDVAGNLNNLRAIQERDLAISLTLVGTHFYDTTTPGGYDQSSDSQMINQNRINADTEYGAANYDIGHLFATTGTGLAYTGVAATPYSATINGSTTSYTYKAGAVSGNLNRTSPASYYASAIIAHEMGHQFSASHTFNANAGSCLNSRESSSAWEPGQGSTIMSYGDGGCGTDVKIQPQTDPYYHAGSIAQMRNHLDSVVPTAGTSYNSDGTAPAVMVPANKTIPQGTPFKLTATGTDPDAADVLKYNWDELDRGSAATFTTPQVAGDNVPLFRSVLPSADGATRYFPRLSYLSGSPSASSNTSERLPTVARTLSFRCVVRDDHVVGSGAAASGKTTSGIVGGVVRSDLVTLTVSDANSQPFAVTAPNTAVKWAAGTTKTVTWNGVGTKSSAVSCQTVNIRLSTDGGVTYPTVLAAGVPNADGAGSASITVPAVNTTTARVMVEAADNYFFDISDTDFTITTGPLAVSLSPTSGPVGTLVTITGENFGTSAADLSVTFNGVAASIVGTPASTSIQVQVPATALTGPVVVARTGAGAGSSSPGTFTVTPVLNSINPTSGAEGSVVTLSGTGLGGATQVSFNGATVKAASFTSTNYTSQPNTITLTVPTGATTGLVVLTTAGGPSNGVTFAVTTFTFSTLGMSPAAGMPAADARSNIVASLNGPPSPGGATANALLVSSLQAGGRRAGTSLVTGNTLVFDPTTDFRAGEVVQVSLTTAATASSGAALARPYVSQFITRTRATRDLRASTDYAAGVGARPDHVVAGDLNNDGSLDLVVVNRNGNSVSVLLNNGTGTGFAAEVGSPIAMGVNRSGVDATPEQALLADLNNDGSLDLLVVCSGGLINLFKGNGDGTFAAQAALPTPSPNNFPMRQAAVGDLNGDGNLDFVAAVPYNNVGWAFVGLGNGSFGFTTSVYTGLGLGASAVVLTDVNEDGRLDLASANYDGGSVSVRLGNGAGSFTGSTNLSVSSSRLYYLATADFNSDGHADLVATDPFSSGSPLQVWLGLGDGTFGAANTLATGGTQSLTVSTGDYNGDGTADIIAPRGNYLNGGVDIFTYVAGSGFRTAAAFSGPVSKFAIGYQPRYVALADVNNDQALDFITANSNGANSVSVALANVQDNPLPVVLLSFAGTRHGAEAVQLSWRTASELHSAGFVVERSLDGQAFQAVSGLLPSLGSSQTGHAYAFLDQSAPSTQLYYRLRQVDVDGSVHYSPIVAVGALASIAADPADQLVLYPNPATAAVMVQLSGTASAAPVLVLNTLGQQVLCRPVLAPGQALELPLAGLSPGLYVVRCGTLTQRLTVE